jgi:hypothetical protein
VKYTRAGWSRLEDIYRLDAARHGELHGNIHLRRSGSPGASPLGKEPYHRAMLVGIVNLRPSTSASCFNPMIASQDIPDAGAENISIVLFQ